jgi:acetyltransferase-like isoleucine patch superfamily enzyme
MIRIAKVIAKIIYSWWLAARTKSRIMPRVNVNFNTKLEGRNVIHSGSNIANSTIGYGTYIGPDSILPNSIIGKYCSIAGSVRVVAGSHPTHTFVSTHPAFFSVSEQSGFTYVDTQKFSEFKYVIPSDQKYISIGNDVWIAMNVMIMNGCRIGNGVIVAAGAIVTKDLDPYGIYAGVPARRIAQRFDDQDIKYLETFQWWERSPQWLREHSHLFTDLSLLKKAFEIADEASHGAKD